MWRLHQTLGLILQSYPGATFLRRRSAKAMFSILAGFFLAFTILMVLFVLFLGYLEWRSDRALHGNKALPPRAKVAR